MNNTVGPTNATGVKEGNPKREQPLSMEKIVIANYKNGYGECDNHRHYCRRGKLIVGAAYREIYEQMDPGQVAKCTCEKKALREMWGRGGTNRYTTEYVLPGTYQKGIEGHCGPKEIVRKVFKLAYKLVPAVFKQLAVDFPSYYFIGGEADHDHPVAHARTQIAAMRLVDGLPKGDLDSEKRYLDLYGNPMSNKWTNKLDGIQIDTVVERVTGKDFIRAAEKWGDWQDRSDVWEATLRDYTLVPNADVKAKGLDPGNYNGFISVHTLYYMQLNEIATLLAAAKPGALLHAVVHRHKGLSGTINCGEQSYRKTTSQGRLHVTQANVLTGESYSHPDVEYLFESDSWAPEPMHDSNGKDITPNGVSWTINKFCDDTYYIKMVSVPARHCRMSERLFFEQFNDLKNPQAQLELNNTVHIEVNQQLVVCTDVAPSTFKDMLLHADGKARTAEQFKDHLAATKRAMRKCGEDGYSANSTAVASFLSRFDSDLELTRKTIGGNQEAVKSLQTALAGHAPCSARNFAEKALLFTAVLCSAKSKCPEKTIASVARMGSELLRSNGTTCAG